MSYDFQTTTHGKWILAGEHTVLRGHGALVFPILGKKLTLSYKKQLPGLALIIQDRTVPICIYSFGVYWSKANNYWVNH